MWEEPTNSECCRRVQDAEVSDASTHAVENHQQRGGVNEKWKSWKVVKSRDGVMNSGRVERVVKNTVSG